MSSQATNVRGIVLLHYAAIAVSGFHSIADAVLIFTTMSPFGALAYAAIAVVAFGGWLRSLAAFARDGRSGRIGAAIAALVWAALANGATIVYCMPPCEAGLWADAIHIGSIVLGVAAAASMHPFFSRRSSPATG